MVRRSRPIVWFILGTRPEAIKCAPVIERTRREGSLITRLLVTSQHQELQDSVLELFQLQPDWDLGIMQENQRLVDVVSRLWEGICGILAQEQPDLILVQGDTTSAFIGGLVGAFHHIPVGHIEAGLRTYRDDIPFPEEIQRRLLTHLAQLHFAPTEHARRNLLKEAIPADRIHVVGNPGIDTFRRIAASELPPLDPRVSDLLEKGKRLIVATTHRREHWGAILEGICRAIRDVITRNTDTALVHMVHPNPVVRESVERIFHGVDRVVLLPSQPYAACLAYLKAAYLLLTDSGGVQEEGPYLGKPVLVLRDITERPEGVEAGSARVVGISPEKIIEETERLLHDQAAYRAMAQVRAPYGDGQTAERIVRIIINFLKRKGGHHRIR